MKIENETLLDSEPLQMVAGQSIKVTTKFVIKTYALK